MGLGFNKESRRFFGVCVLTVSLHPDLYTLRTFHKDPEFLNNHTS